MLFTVSQAAKELGVSTEHVRRQIRAGRWPYYQLGKKGTRIDVQEIKALGRLIAEGDREKQAAKKRAGNE